MESVEKFGLVIIESLRINDKNTGTLLHTELLKYKKFKEPNLSTELYVIKTKAELFALLNKLYSEVKDEHFFPILHFETHGFIDGIQLGSDEIVTWDQVIPYFIKINILLKNHLVIHLGMCNGSGIIRYINPRERSPFMAILGTVKEVKAEELYHGFEQYYDHFFFSFQPLESLELLNKEIVSSDLKFEILFSNHCFDKISDFNYNPEAMMKKIKETALTYSKTQKYRNIPLEKIEEIVEENFKKEFEQIKNNKDYFLIKDI